MLPQPGCCWYGFSPDDGEAPIAVLHTHHRRYHQTNDMTKQSPEVIEVNTQQMEEVLKRVSDKMDEDDALLLRRIVESYGYVSDLVEDKRTTIARLRKLFFGARSEKTKDIVGDPEDPQEAGPPCSEHVPEARSENELPDGDGDGDGDNDVDSTKPRAPGHGRHGAEDYVVADRWQSRIQLWLWVTSVRSANKVRFTRRNRGFWFVLWARHRCSQRSTGCRNFAATCAEEFLRLPLLKGSASRNTTALPPA